MIMQFFFGVGGGGVVGGLNQLYHGRTSGVVVCTNANDITTVFSVNHYRVYYIGILVTERCKHHLMGLKTAIQRVFFRQQFGFIRAFPSILYL